MVELWDENDFTKVQKESDVSEKKQFWNVYHYITCGLFGVKMHLLFPHNFLCIWSLNVYSEFGQKLNLIHGC